MADLQDLLSRLKSAEAPGNSSTPAANPLSHLFATPDSSSKPSPSVRPLSSPVQDASNKNRSANLLNLLKFNGVGSPSPASAFGQTVRRSESASGIATSTLVTASDENRPKQSSLHISKNGEEESSQRSRDVLLNLLNRSQQTTPSAGNPPPVKTEASSQDASPSPRIFGSTAQNQDTGFTSPSLKGPVFSHVNPFEQLASSRGASPGPGLPTGQQKAASQELGSTAARSNSKSPLPSPLPDGRSQQDTLLGTGPGQADKSSNRVADRASTDQQALATTSDEGKQAGQKVAGKSSRKDARDSVSNPGAEHDSWESADADEASKEVASVRVYNFPMKPFVSITIRNSSPSTLRDDVIMKIASLKKEFDQVDRALATASANFIVYALAKGGGARAIRQDTGDNKLLFRGNGNTMFNVALSAPRSSPLSKESEPVLLTGTNGSVYWTSLPTTLDEFDKADLDQRGFILPPIPSSEEPSSTTQLKTRARKSSRHPEFFAVGRGKSIYIIHPSVASTSDYTNARTRVVDSAKYFDERSLKVSTGKAGKDFTFSEDDTVLASLDKSGRLKFWDILPLTGSEHGMRTGKRPPQEVKTPLFTLMVDVSAERSSPTSVQFVDKERPTLKGSALRYMLVGLRQNHSLQLWDLGLGKAVQELNLPHDSDTDPICSISYHAKSGIVAIGHPKRNSVFLVHLSAPRYNLDMMSQANYIKRLALKDETLPKPESTAIMSGLREISFASIGDLRSLEVIAPSSFTVEKLEPEDETLFEMYAMHSRGVTCLSMKRRDLGWSSDGKVLDALDAESEGVVTVKKLQAESAADGPAADENVVESVLKSQVNPKAESAKAESPAKLPPTTNGESKAEKKKAKKRGDDTQDLSAVPPPTITLEITTDAVKSATKPTPSEQKTSQSSSSREMEPATVDAAKNVAAAASISMNPAVVSAEQLPSVPSISQDTNSQASHEAIAALFERLYKRIDDERRVQEAAGNSRQDAVLRLVSSTLTENVEKSLNRIISQNVQQSVAPAASSAATASINQTLSEMLPQQLASLLPREVKSSMQAGLLAVLQHKDVLKEISSKVSSQVNSQIQAQLDSVLQKSLVPTIRDVGSESAQKVATEVERRLGEQLRQAEAQRRADADKIDRLANASQDLMQHMQVMQQSLATMQQEMTQLRVQLSEQQKREQGMSESTPPTGLPQAELVADEELASIQNSMAAGKAEEATIRWLQSSRQTELFDKFFVQCDPSYLQNLNQLVALSVSMAVTSSLGSHVQHRVAWLEVVMENFDIESPDVADYAPRPLEVLSGRMQDAYMEIADKTQGNPILPKISALVRRIRDLRALLPTS